MIRLVFTLRRKPGMALADFQRYWRETHGPLVAKSSVALNILRYVQLHGAPPQTGLPAKHSPPAARWMLSTNRWELACSGSTACVRWRRTSAS